uniref:Uncharacterized protein LOC104212839 n=1 Tax=Nicotiana sylvestris TaxID=4096 RepID=A0A1U7VDW6_NICSY|nr:PREDICTED: uncharacterized protein LOC104212839 [Nicotiana sylvestris]
MPILDYGPNIRDEVRRYYINKGPCQPIGHAFPKTKIGSKMRQLSPTWFRGPYSQWLEYSIKGDTTFCLCCYLFKNELESHENVGGAFTKDGFRGWNKGVERFKAHVGEVNNIHHKCFNRMLDLKSQRQSIQSSFDKQSEKVKSDYRMRLNASIDVARFLLISGFPFRGHDESEESEYKGGFPKLLEWHGDRRPDVGRVILRHALQNDMMICIQKEIVEACAKETTKAIIEDLDDYYFAILVDESKDDSHKEQMVLILRYVNKSGMAIERFLGIVHVLLFTNELNKALQKKDQDIVNAMGMLDLAKKRLQIVRETEWNSLLDEVCSFCSKHDSLVPKMDEDYTLGKSKHKRSEVLYLHHFHVEVFYTIIDLEFQELNDRFDVVNIDLLLGMASLSPVDSFVNFDKDRIMKLAGYYPSIFGDNKLRKLDFQLDSFIVYAQKCDSRFLNLKGIKDFARVMIEKNWILLGHLFICL